MSWRRGLTLLSILAVWSWALRAQPQDTMPSVSIRHISTGFAQGQCSERFGIGTEMGEGDLGDLIIELDFLTESGKLVYRGRIETSLTDTTAGRYVEEYVESEELCEGPISSVVVTRARATLNGRTTDLVKSKLIHQSRFVPYGIRIAK